MGVLDRLDDFTGACGVALTLLGSPLLRLFYRRWGARRGEILAPLPGDELAKAAVVSTRAIDIDAPRETVWALLGQLGQERGGLYSYEGLENLAGCRMHNADGILPGPRLAPGDLVRGGPEGYPCWRVVFADPPCCLALQACDPKTGEAVASTWSFRLRPTPNGSRLIVRNRLPATPFYSLVVDPVAFVMERRMLLGLRERAERLCT